MDGANKKIMGKFKTKKALLKRIRITGTNKIMKRPPNQNHFNALDSGEETRNKKGEKLVPKEIIKSAKALISTF